MNRSNESPAPLTASPGRSSFIARVGAPLALLWLVAYLVFFFSFDLPNSNPRMARGTLLKFTPLLLIMNVEAETEPGQEPATWANFPERFDLLLVVGFIALAAWGSGALILRAIGLRSRLDPPEQLFCAVGLGLAWLSLLTLGCGLAGMLNRPLFVTLLTFPVLVEAGGFWHAWRRNLRHNPLPLEEGGAERRVAAVGGKELREGRGLRSARRRTPSRTEATDSPRGASEAAAPWDVPRWLKFVCLSAMLPFFLAMLLGSLLPPTDFDTKAYHLVGPKEWYQQGAITFLSHNVYTSFPFLTEMLCLLGMVLRGDWYRGTLVGQGVLMLFGPLTALGLFAAGRRWFSPLAGWMAATIHLSTPWIYRISIIPYAEGGLTFYLFAALWGTWRGVEALRASRDSDSHRESSRGEPELKRNGEQRVVFRLFLLAGLFAGSGMACKYPGVVQVVIPMGVVALLAPFWKGVAVAEIRRAGWFRGLFRGPASTVPEAGEAAPVLVSGIPGSNEGPPHPRAVSAWRTGLICASIYTFGVALTIGPWLAKNVVETGNPVYPLMYTLFGGRDLSPELNTQWRAGHSPPHHRAADLAEKFIDVTAKSDWLSPLLFGLAPLALFRRPRRGACWLILLLAYLFLGWWLLTHRIDRFWVPLIPVVSLLAGVGFDWNPSRAWRVGAGLIVVFCVAFNLAFVTTGYCGFNAYLAAEKSLRRMAEATAPAVAALNQLPEDAVILCVGEAQVFDARRTVYYNTVFDVSLFEEWLSAPEFEGSMAAATPPGGWAFRPTAEIRETLRQRGITHILVNWQELLRYRTTYGYTDFVAPGRMAELRRRRVLGTPLETETYREVSGLDARSRKELETWGQGLLSRRMRPGDGKLVDVFPAYEIFPVLK